MCVGYMCVLLHVKSCLFFRLTCKLSRGSLGDVHFKQIEADMTFAVLFLNVRHILKGLFVVDGQLCSV